MEFLTYLVDFILHIDAHLFELVEQYGMWIYAILFIIVFCETGLVVTPFLPGDSLLFASGVVAGAGLMGYGHVLLVLLAAGIMGDAVNYFIGRHVGPAIFQRDSRFIKKASQKACIVIIANQAGKIHIAIQISQIRCHIGSSAQDRFNMVNTVHWYRSFW